MLRTRLLTATAAIALFAAGSSFAQDAGTTAPTSPTPAPTEPMPAQTMAPAPSATPAPTSQTAAPQASTTPAAGNTVVDVLRANGQFTTLLGALEAAQLTSTLTTQPAISIFAPTDAAFAALPEADRTRLLDPANVNDLRQLLLYHVVVADVSSDQIEGTRGGVQTAANTEVQLDGTGDAIKVDAATVTTADVDASNGSVFIIDRVLNPAESQVATGDADETATPATTDAAAPAQNTTTSDDAADTATPPATDTDMTDDSTDATTTGDDSVAAPPATDSSATMTAPEATTAPAQRPTTTMNAPSGQPATTVTTTASPPVANPTDGQVDDAGDVDDADGDTTTTTTPTPRPQS